MGIHLRKDGGDLKGRIHQNPVDQNFLPLEERGGHGKLRMPAAERLTHTHLGTRAPLEALVPVVGAFSGYGEGEKSERFTNQSPSCVQVVVGTWKEKQDRLISAKIQGWAKVFFFWRKGGEGGSCRSSPARGI